MKVLTVAGARPEFSRTAAVSRVAREAYACGGVLVHAGQHWNHEMPNGPRVSGRASEPSTARLYAVVQEG